MCTKNRWTDHPDDLTNLGDKLKKTGNVHWSSPMNNTTNEPGFTPLYGGTRYIYENGGIVFEYINTTTIFWSGTMTYTRSAYGEKADGFRGAFSSSKFGFCVRCIKD